MDLSPIKHKRLTVIPLTANLNRVKREVVLSSKKKVGSLENFELFYEEITKTKVLQNRVKRIRRAAVATQ